jgi:hypothetical protein
VQPGIPCITPRTRILVLIQSETSTWEPKQAFRSIFGKELLSTWLFRRITALGAVGIPILGILLLIKIAAITLIPDAGTSGSELINLVVPFPESAIGDAPNVRILDDKGAEVPAYVVETIKWHKDGSVRAVKVQFIADMSIKL